MSASTDRERDLVIPSGLSEAEAGSFYDRYGTKLDWGEPFEGAAKLCGAVEDLFHKGEVHAALVVMDSKTREGSILLNTLVTLANHRA